MSKFFHWNRKTQNSKSLSEAPHSNPVAKILYLNGAPAKNGGKGMDGFLCASLGQKGVMPTEMV